MRSETITLFSRRPQRETGPSAFAVSMIAHGCVFLVVLAGMRQVRVVDRHFPDREHAMRLLNMRESAASARWYPPKSILHRNHGAGSHSGSAGAKRALTGASHHLEIATNFQTPKPAPQTLIQPEVPPDQQVLPQLPIPHAMVWTAGEIVHKKVVTPAPQPIAAVKARPSLAKPNQELNPTDVALASIPLQAEARMPLAGTTSPVKVDAPTPAKQIPETASIETTAVSPARIIAMSDQKLETGIAALPVVNEIAKADAPGTPTMAQDGGEDANSKDTSAGQQIGSGAGHGAGDLKGADQGFTIHNGSLGTENAGLSEGLAADAGAGSAPVEHITLPKGGQYGMVVVGASPEEDYPETADLWTGRLVYTVYLQTHTAQNWVLQYSLLRSLANASNGTRPDAPWPFDMMRPSLDPYKDIVLVHGFVNTAGRFEQLSIAYPPAFPKSAMLLRSLKRWEFRPAMDQGQPATVEVLLIIPGEED